MVVVLLVIVLLLKVTVLVILDLRCSRLLMEVLSFYGVVV